MRYLGSIVLIFCIFLNVNAADDDFEAIKAKTDVTIDGIGDEQCWTDAPWYNLDYVWIPYNAVIPAEDFTGRFKISWTDEELLLLVEITDDSLYDGHSNPTQNYWDDDCVEVFLDEDHSGGPHGSNYNAWAYHISKDFDVADAGDSQTGALLFNDHVNGEWTVANGVYTWEIAIKIFDDTYVTNGDNTPVTLTHEKVMGFSLAYCDNDGSMYRENFIGSKYLDEPVANNSYLDASIFGSLTLIDPDYVAPDRTENINIDVVNIFPNPAKDFIRIDNANLENGSFQYLIFDNTGNTVLSGSINTNEENATISTSDLISGKYFLQIIEDQKIRSTAFSVIK